VAEKNSCERCCYKALVSSGTCIIAQRHGGEPHAWPRVTLTDRHWPCETVEGMHHATVLRFEKELGIRDEVRLDDAAVQQED